MSDSWERRLIPYSAGWNNPPAGEEPEGPAVFTVAYYPESDDLVITSDQPTFATLSAINHDAQNDGTMNLEYDFTRVSSNQIRVYNTQLSMGEGFLTGLVFVNSIAEVLGTWTGMQLISYQPDAEMFLQEENSYDFANQLGGGQFDCDNAGVWDIQVGARVFADQTGVAGGLRFLLDSHEAVDVMYASSPADFLFATGDGNGGQFIVGISSFEGRIIHGYQMLAVDGSSVGRMKTENQDGIRELYSVSSAGILTANNDRLEIHFAQPPVSLPGSVGLNWCDAGSENGTSFIPGQGYVVQWDEQAIILEIPAFFASVVATLNKIELRPPNQQATWSLTGNPLPTI